MDADGVQKILKDVCGDGAFDEETVAYLASMICEEEPDNRGPRELWDLIGDYLEDAGLADNEKAGVGLCTKLADSLNPGRSAFKPPARAAAATGGKLGSQAQSTDGGGLQTPVILSSLITTEQVSGADFADVHAGMSDTKLKGQIDEMPQVTLKVVAAVSKAKKEKAARRAERKAWGAESKTEDDAVWVDLPAGQSIGQGNTAVDFHLVRYSLPNKKGNADLLTNVSCTFAQGRRYGLLGRNGVGKSTFLDAVARREVPGVPSCSMFYVRQEVEGDNRTAVEWVLQADSEKLNLEIEKQKLESESGSETNAKAGERLTQIYQRLEELSGGNAHEQERKTLSILSGLGFDEALRSKPTSDLSGGWRMRVALACALFVSPGLLLLDEPTNHLDLETVLWLERYLTTEFSSTLLVVSHDRVFLNEVVTDIVLFEKEALEMYRGDYNAFENVREEQKLRQERLREAQEMKREHLQEFITKHAEAGNNGCKAAAQRKARIRKLDRLGMEAQATIDGRKLKLSYDGPQDDVEEVKEAATVTIKFPDPGVCDSLGNPLMRLDDVEFGYGTGPSLFGGVSFSVEQNSRIAILGKNGAGKSTLIKLLLGKLKARAGTFSPHRGATVEYIAQHHLDELDGESTPLRMALERYPGDGSNSHGLRIRQHLGHFGLSGEVLPHQQIRTLSGGQKFRVSLALALYRKPHLIVMDEPTNHLDLETIDALGEAIKTFEGGVLLVSHDEHLIGTVCKELFVIGSRRVNRLKGTIKDYKARVLAGKSVV